MSDYRDRKSFTCILNYVGKTVLMKLFFGVFFICFFVFCLVSILLGGFFGGGGGGGGVFLWGGGCLFCFSLVNLKLWYKKAQKNGKL